MKRPRVVLNAGMTLDGKIASKSRDVEISCKEDLERVHEIRKSTDAIMVGIGTILDDDPRLTVHKVPGKRDDNPLRVVADSTARTPLDARVLSEAAKTVIAVSKAAPKDRVPGLEKKAEIIVCGETKVDLECLMKRLYERGVKTLLLEGGGNLNWGMLERDLIDEVKVAISPRIVGGKDALTLVEGEGFERIREGVKLKLKKHYQLGMDLILEYEVLR
ncbi:MAG: 2,5-diamino-6-(ribosylamino)-4(3H)-pyrimidinone 5'-phosphate reductase [Candidatus Hydrothermarchaeaceae archaeon]